MHMEVCWLGCIYETSLGNRQKQKFVEWNRTWDKVKYTDKVKVKRMDLTLRTDWRRNKIKTGYQLRFVFWKIVLIAIQFMFEIIWRVFV